MRDYTNIIVLIILAIVARLLYSRYKTTEDNRELSEHYKLVDEYLIGNSEDDLVKSKEPIIWIHVDRGINARNWESFGSRNSTKLNQPYLFITMKSIVDKCTGSFNICLIDDDAFRRLVPDWSIDLDQLSEPSKSAFRQLGLCQLLYYYGGMTVPASTLCMRDFRPLYDQAISVHDTFVVENVNRSVSATQFPFFPDVRFMGCKKRSPIMQNIINMQSTIGHNNFTDQPEFAGTLNTWCYEQHRANMLTMIDGKYIGAKTVDGKPVTLDALLGSSDIDFHPTMLGIYIPSDEVLTRTHYQWFPRMSTDQILASNMIIANYALASY
jgi:hypothetical protein